MTTDPTSHRPSWLPSWITAVPDAWRAFGAEHTIRIEEFRTDDAHVVRAELPGVDPTEVSATLADSTLHLRAERRLPREELDGESFRTELVYGLYTRDVELESDLDPESLTVTARDGIVEVRLAVRPAA